MATTTGGAETAGERQSLVARVRGALTVLGGTPRVVAMVWRAHPPTAAIVLLLNVLQGLSPLLNGWLAKLILDAVAGAVSGQGGLGDPMDAAPAIVALLVARAAYQVFNAAVGAPTRYFWQQLSDYMTRDVERLILDKANSFKGIAFFESPRFFDLLQRAQNQAGFRPVNMIDRLNGIVRTSLSLVSMTVVYFLFSPWITLLIVVAMAPHLVSQFRNRREMYTIDNWSIPEVRKMGYLTCLLTDQKEAKEVRLFGLGDYFLNQYRETFEAFRHRHQAVRVRHWWQTMGMATLSAGAYAVGYGAIVVAAVGGQITLGDFAFLYAALNQMQGGIGALVSLISGLFEDNLYFGTLFELQAVEDTLPVAPTGAGRRVAAPLRSGIELRNVSFTYDRAAKPVLEDVSFTVAPGQVVALVGENGAGKSTLVKLLTRLYDPTGGQVLVDGSDLREYDLEDWRRRVGVVFQDFKRYTMPVRENIGLGNLTQIEDTDAVRAAALRAGADSLVERLPDGYETMLGRRFRSIGNDGVDLSGGEWQRIALARAFMRAPEAGPEVGPGATGTNGANGANGRHDGLDGGAQLLILDEPTSALDARAEHEVYLRFKELTRGRATLLISHRFSTVRMADHILVLDGGRIVEQGSHEALVELDGMYARLYAMQAERYA